jgi:opacity protein-like surface antigen
VAHRNVGYSSVNQTNTGSSLAWHATAGIQAHITERTILAVAYNYFDGGNIPFPNYLLTQPSSSPPAPPTRSTVPWTGRFRANEVNAGIRVLF